MLSQTASSSATKLPHPPFHLFSLFVTSLEPSIKPSIIYSVHAALNTVDVNLIGRRANDRATLPVSQVHSFIRLTVVSMVQNPRRGEKCRRKCLRNGRECLEKERVNDPLPDSVTEYEDYSEVQHMPFFEPCHDVKRQDFIKNDRKKKKDFEGLENLQFQNCICV